MKAFIAVLILLSPVAHAADLPKISDVVEFKIQKRIPHYCDTHGCGASDLVRQDLMNKVTALCKVVEGENGLDELQKLKVKVIKASFTDVYDHPGFENEGAYVDAVDVDFAATCVPDGKPSLEN